MNAVHVKDLTSQVCHSTAWLTRAFSVSQAIDERFAQLPNQQHLGDGVNRLATDVGVIKLG